MRVCGSCGGMLVSGRLPLAWVVTALAIEFELVTMQDLVAGVEIGMSSCLLHW